MRSVADDFRSESRRDLARLTPAERVELSLRLGDDDVALLRAARDIRDDEARRLIARSRQHGRVPSAAAAGGET
jgi:hypothetical protein